jgi:hypothetical protein
MKLINPTKIIYSNEGNPFLVEEADEAFFIDTHCKNNSEVTIIDMEKKVRYIYNSVKKTKLKGSEDGIRIDDTLLSNCTKFNKITNLDLRYLGLYLRSKDTFKKCFLSNDKNPNIFLTDQEKMNWLINLLLVKSSNFEEIFTIERTRPYDEDICLYLERLSYLILIEQKKNGEIDNLNDLKIEAHALAQLTCSLEEIEKRSIPCRGYMRYLLTKDDYIVIQQSQLEKAQVIRDLVLENNHVFIGTTNIYPSGYESKQVELNDYNVLMTKFNAGLHYGSDKALMNFVKYVDENLSEKDWSEFTKRVDFKTELGLNLLTDKDLGKLNYRVCVFVIDRSYSYRIFRITIYNSFVLDNLITPAKEFLKNFCVNIWKNTVDYLLPF